MASSPASTRRPNNSSPSSEAFPLSLFPFPETAISLPMSPYPDFILWKANRDGSNPMQLSEPADHTLSCPDGRRMAHRSCSRTFGSGPYFRSEIYIVSAQGGNPRKLLPEGTGVQSDPDWSPDGHKVVFGTSWGGQGIQRA